MSRQFMRKTPINKKRKLFDRPRMSSCENNWSPFLIVFYAWNIIEIPSLSVCHVSRCWSRSRPSNTAMIAKSPFTEILPLTATTSDVAERTNPSGKTDANLIDTLGSTNSSSNNVHLKPFSTSILSFLNWIIATVTKICTKDHSRLTHVNPSP